MPYEVRQPAVAGMFYENGREDLRRTLSGLFSGLKEGPRYKAVISPHAGYVYSGRTAARALSLLEPGKRFIILGPSHTGLGADAAVMASGSWQTPLGKAAVDTDMAREVLKSGLAEEDPLAHAREHSIEVQLPLLLHLFGPGISFVPLVIRRAGQEGLSRLGSALAAIAKKHDARLIASSDFSHYISWESAKVKDGRAIERIKDLDIPGFLHACHDASICGSAPIAALMAAARDMHLKQVDVLDYTSSGEVTGDMHEVVAYAAIGFRQSKSQE